MSRPLALLLVFLGAVLGARMWMVFTAPQEALFSYAGKTAIIEGVVADDPDRRETSVRVVLSLGTLNGEPLRGRVLVTVPRDTEVRYGDTLAARGALTAPEPFETRTGRTFDYPGYLEARGISLLMPHAQLRAQEEGGWSVLGALFLLKHRFERALERVMREPQASLMEGLLLGEKSGLPDALIQAFVTTGLIHIVVLSGYNIGIVAEWVTRLLSLVLRRRAALVAAGLTIVLFALLSGGGMATLRAVLMGVLALIARYLNRPAAALRGLFIAAALMVLWNPLVLMDVGFILSILATFGLITLSPWVESKLSFMREGAVRSVAGTTIAVQLFILPALLYFTGVLSLISVPLNVAVLPFVPFAMLLGFLAGSLALLHPYLALLPALMADALLAMVVGMTQAAAGVPLAAVVVPAFPAWVAWVAYAPLGALAIWAYSRSEPRSRSS